MKCVNITKSDKPTILDRVGCYEFPFISSFYDIILSKAIYRIELFGASGGTSEITSTGPGKGGSAKGTITIRNRREVFLFVGGKGGDGIAEDNYPGGSAGYNGGATGSTGIGSYPTGGSGGATDIRLEKEALESRIIVAGGGGSAGFWRVSGKGGDGGGISGEKGGTTSQYGIIGGDPGTQTSGASPGKGESGEQGNSDGSEAGGAGGGGYWGGFGGRTGGNSNGGSGGGGGSSFISGHPDCVVVDKDGKSLNTNIHPSKLVFTSALTETGVNEGNGRAIIKLIRIADITYNKSFSKHMIHFFIILILSK